MKQRRVALTLVFLAGVTAVMAILFLLSELAATAQAAPSVLCVVSDGVGCDPASCGTTCYATVQNAVDAAGSGDLIKVAAGIYTGVQSCPVPLGYNGPSEVTQVVYISKTVTIHRSCEFFPNDPCPGRAT